MRRMLQKFAAAALVLLVAGSAMAGPLQQGQVPASAMWVLHGDVEAFLHSAVGAFFLEQVKKPEAQAGLTVLRNLSGIDLTRDIRSITLYGTAPGDANGVALVQGTFDQEKLLPLLRTNPTLKELKVDERTVYEWTDNPKADRPGPQRFGMFYRSDLAIVAGSRSMLDLAVTVLDGGPETLASKVKAKPAAGVYLGIYVNQLPDLPEDKKGAELLRKLVAGRLEVGESNGNFFAYLNIAARDSATASNLAKMAQGFLAFLDLVKDLHDNDRPVIPPPAVAMLKDIKVSTQETTTDVSLVSPTGRVVDLLGWLAAQEAAKRHQPHKEK